MTSLGLVLDFGNNLDHDAGKIITRSVSFEVALFTSLSRAAGGSDAVAAGEGPLRALEPDSPGGRMKLSDLHLCRNLQ